ncbi:hypothetical protein C8Q75DRAFT_794239 [Abortiporus biennis]|nr:hypothetical protein C8Q75DRAFT_794239 [Abortiporus biennis]
MTELALDAWCPVCTRQIIPKRYQVPVTPATPAPPPSSPTSPELPQVALKRGKHGTIRPRGGLLQGTGRVKPNGTIKRSPKDQQQQPTKKATSNQPSKPSAPVPQRTLIDQGPLPLYCSDECRLADLQLNSGAPLDYHPDRYSSPPLPPVPHNSYSDISSSETESNSSISTLLSESATERPQYAPSRAIAAVNRLYGAGFCPCPPPPPLLRTDTSSSEESSNDYESGIMMAARRVGEALLPQPQPKRAAWSTPSAALSTAYALGANSRQETIPGWTDGSNKWREHVYSFTAPPRSDRTHVDDVSKAYKSFVATPHRSRGVTSTLGESSINESRSTSSLPPHARSTPEVDKLYSKFSESLSRRSESRINMAAQHALPSSPTGSTRSLPTSNTAPTRVREVPILKPGAEGKLLVPNVKMRRTSSNMSNYETSSSSSWSSYPPTVAGSNRKRSPLSRQNSDMSTDISDLDADDTIRPSSLPTTQRTQEVRSWSYSDILTYPIMQLPQKERRMVRRLVDGKECVEEVVVDVYPERKRLFNFPPKSEVFPRH